ncbi:Uncharacterised protein at_DN1791 [Pycnogonum litorale]
MIYNNNNFILGILVKKRLRCLRKYHLLDRHQQRYQQGHILLSNGTQWLIIADYYSKFPIIKRLPQHSPSNVVVTMTKEIFSEYGISDNGPHFSSQQYYTFAKDWSCDHTTTSPRYPKANGFIERHIRTIKQLLKKSDQSKTDYNLALLSWRATPINNSLPSPGKMLMGREPRINLPSKIPNNLVESESIHSALTTRQELQKTYHDQHSRKDELPILISGQAVRVQHPDLKHWEPAIVISRADTPRSYIL